MSRHRPADITADASEAATSDEVSPTISKDDAFHIIQNKRRRAVLRYLLANADTDRFRMRDLAEEIAAWEHDTTVRQLTSDERQRVYIALYQSHLPKLDDHGVIEYNQSRGVVEPTALLNVFSPYLDEALHDETDHLTIDRDATLAPDRPSGQRLTRAVITLFNN